MRILTISFIFLSFVSFGQITLENSYTTIQEPNRYLLLIELETSGKKYCHYSTANNYLNLYNLNHSVFRTITLSLPLGTITATPTYISETLFDTDSSDIEFIIQGTLSGGVNYIRIYREDGTILFSADTAQYGNHSGNPAFGNRIQNTVNGTKMIIDHYGQNKIKVYSLPGKLLCGDPCQESADSSASGISNNNPEIETSGLRNNFPNPTNSYTIIPYNLPKNCKIANLTVCNLNGDIVKSYQVDNTFDHLKISTEHLSAGTYYYILDCNGSKIGAKTMIVVK